MAFNTKVDVADTELEENEAVVAEAEDVTLEDEALVEAESDTDEDDEEADESEDSLTYSNGVIDLLGVLGLNGNADPFNVVLGQAGVLDRANACANHVTVALGLNDRHVLFVRRILSVCGQLRATGRGRNVVAKGGDKLTVGVLKEFRHDVLLCLCADVLDASYAQRQTNHPRHCK